MPPRLRRFDPSEWPSCSEPFNESAPSRMSFGRAVPGRSRGSDTCPPGVGEYEAWRKARSEWRDEHLHGIEVLGHDEWAERERVEDAEVLRLAGPHPNHWHSSWVGIQLGD
jgi:hypothetical protein